MINRNGPKLGRGEPKFPGATYVKLKPLQYNITAKTYNITAKTYYGTNGMTLDAPLVTAENASTKHTERAVLDDPVLLRALGLVK